MNPGPDERFEQVQRILNQLSNSQRHLLTAQVLLNDRMDRAETAIQRLSEENAKFAGENAKLAEKTNTLTDNVNTLINIIRQWYERHGNGTSGQQPS